MISPIKVILAATVGVLLWTGCARFSTTQTDISYDAKTGTKIRQITTQAKAGTFYDSKSALANFKASQTDKTQSASVGSLTQESSGTNLNQLAESIISGIVQGAIKGAKTP